MKIYTIEQKMSGTGTAHDIASDAGDREIRFPKGSIYAVVISNYYGGIGYTTHRSEDATCKMASNLQRRGYSYEIIDADGNRYDNDHGTIRAI